jgi:uncharacterized membrane protein
MDMPIIVLIILATVFYTLYDVFASKASSGIDPNASSVIFNGIGALIPLFLYACLKARKGMSMATTKSGIVYSILAGVAIAIFSILFVKIFQKGNLSYVVPLIYGGTIVLASLIGIVLFHDKFNLLQGVGIAVITIGVILIVVAKM